MTEKPNVEPEKESVQVTEEKGQYKRQISLIVSNWTIITVIAVAVMSYVQYAYKYGICLAFHLPISVISINLVDYIPAAALFITISAYFIDINVSVVSEPNKKFRFSPFRIICAATVSYVLLSMIFDSEHTNALLFLLISIAFAFLTEFILKIMIQGQVKNRLKNTYQGWLKNDTAARPLYKFVIKPGIIVLMIVILIIPISSKTAIRGKKEYEICTTANRSYAVIFNNPGSLLLQPAVEEGNTLTIYTGSYRVLERTDIEENVFRTFEQVIITEGREPEATREAQE